LGGYELTIEEMIICQDSFHYVYAALSVWALIDPKARLDI
jgi:hypothetical protein